MKRLMTAAVAVCLAPLAAIAADKGGAPAPTVDTMTAPAPTTYNWSGVYFGAHGGASVKSLDETAIGAHAGIRRQTGIVVIGLEGSATLATVNIPIVVKSKTIADLNAVTAYSVTGTAGIAFDRFLAYGKGGWTWAEGAQGPAYGGGLAYALADHVTVGGEIMRRTLDLAPASTSFMAVVDFKF